MAFDNVGQMEKTIVSLFAMDKESRTALYDSIGFTPISEIYRKAQVECSSFISYEQYLDTRTKYKEVLLFDALDTKNIAPELPMSNPLYAYVVNTDGDVIVGGEKINYTDLKSYDQTTMAQVGRSSKAVERDLNYVHVYDNKRKMWARSYSVDNQVIIIIGQQVLSFWGWNVYDERYWLRAWSGHDVSVWENYKLDYNLNSDGWHVTGWLKDKDGIIVGIRRHLYDQTYEPISEYVRMFANDMGMGNIGDLHMRFN